MALSLGLAVAIGIAFGWALERAGLGSARKLAGQFYLTDFTVFKVMFSGILVAMLGAFWLGRLGIVDLSRVYVPETFIVPQLVGGVIFGAGFVVAGLCPGTSCVAAATGRGDGLFVMLGMFAGVLTTGLAFQSLRNFYDSTARGSLTLPEVLHVPYGVVVLGIVIIALVGFQVGTAAKSRAPHVLASIALIAGAFAVFAGSPYRTDRHDLSPIELASWIKERKPGLRVIDTRSFEEFAELHIPTSERDAKSSPRDEIVVMTAGSVYVLRGGMQGWIDDVLNPHRAPNASVAERAEFERVAAISRYFGGVPRIDDTKDVKRSAAAVRRRGC